MEVRSLQVPIIAGIPSSSSGRLATQVGLKDQIFVYGQAIKFTPNFKNHPHVARKLKLISPRAQASGTAKMAQGLSLQFPTPCPQIPTTTAQKIPSSYPRINPASVLLQIKQSKMSRTSRRKFTQFAIKANTSPTSEGDEEENTPSNGFETKTVGSSQSPSSEPAESANRDINMLGSEIKKAMKERDGRDGGGGDFWSGVAQEIREIEWPAFSKVLGTTGVVLGVIAGSSVVLLTVNAILAELSDQVFAGKGVQDFFG